MTRKEEIMQAAAAYANNQMDIPKDENFVRMLCIALGRAFKDGAYWADGTMMKKAVECDIEGTIIGTDGNFGLARIKGDYNYGDKVKLIIVKED